MHLNFHFFAFRFLFPAFCFSLFCSSLALWTTIKIAPLMWQLLFLPQRVVSCRTAPSPPHAQWLRCFVVSFAFLSATLPCLNVASMKVFHSLFLCFFLLLLLLIFRMFLLVFIFCHMWVRRLHLFIFFLIFLLVFRAAVDFWYMGPCGVVCFRANGTELWLVVTFQWVWLFASTVKKFVSYGGYLLTWDDLELRREEQAKLTHYQQFQLDILFVNCE